MYTGGPSKQQWYLLILATVWLFATLALTADIFYVTKDLRSIVLAILTAPPITMLQRLYRYYFPPGEADYKMQELKLRLKLETAQKKKHETG